jgi:SAM-dependent methyltransferase
VLTIDFDRLDLQPGERLLDLGCGLGRHAHEALIRGADVVTCDLSRPDLEAVRGTALAMIDQGQVDGSRLLAPVQGDGVRLPFATGSFDKIIASEVLEHVPDDASAFDELMRVLRPGGVVAVTVPAWFPEQICWRLSPDYHAPAVEGGHVRIYSSARIRERMVDVGLVPGAQHHAHALHSPYWWLRCAVGPNRATSENRLVSAYQRLLEWDIMKQPRLTRTVEKILNPVLGKSLVVYGRKPATATIEGTAEVASAA